MTTRLLHLAQHPPWTVTRLRMDRAETLAAGALAVALMLWVLSLVRVDVDGMTDLGLVSVLPATFYASLAVLTISFVVLAHLRPQRTALLAGHVGALVLILHATPPLIYGTLRYAWAWKHLGIVDYIQRTGGVTPEIEQLDVYHAWPGFFAFAAVLQDLAGVGDLQAIATWTPLVIAACSTAVVAFALSGLTRDRRVLWLAVGVYVVANWVGQEYFSPQGFGFVLYVLAIGIVLRWLRPTGPGAVSRLPRRLSDGFARAVEHPAAAQMERRERAGVVTAVVVIVAAIVASHALTSIMVTLTLAALAIAGCCRPRTLPLWSAALVALWASTFARHYVGENIGGTLTSIDFPWTTAEENLVDTGELSAGTALVAGGARFMVLLVVGLALVGAVRLLSGRALDPAAAILAVAPATLFLTGDYDGELVFRIYLFALPFLALLVAQIVPLDWRPRALSIGASAATMVVIAGGFVLTHYGNDLQYRFTESEVAAAEAVYRSAEPGSLLVQGTRNAPVQFLNYERFTYVTIADEPPETRTRVIADPVAVIGEWMSDPRFRSATLFITRSQAAEANALGRLPRGGLEAIEAAIEDSPRFTVTRGPDYLIAQLAPARACEDAPAGAGATQRAGAPGRSPCPSGAP